MINYILTRKTGRRGSISFDFDFGWEGRLRRVLSEEGRWKMLLEEGSRREGAVATEFGWLEAGGNRSGGKNQWFCMWVFKNHLWWQNHITNLLRWQMDFNENPKYRISKFRCAQFLKIWQKYTLRIGNGIYMQSRNVSQYDTDALRSLTICHHTLQRTRNFGYTKF